MPRSMLQVIKDDLAIARRIQWPIVGIAFGSVSLFVLVVVAICAATSK